MRSRRALLAVAAAFSVAAVALLAASRHGVVESWMPAVKGVVSEYGLFGVFLATIVAGTLIPVGSPGIVAAGAGLGLPPLPLALAAASGYTVGVAAGYCLGYVGSPLVTRKLSEEELDRLERLWRKHGWKLCLAFGLVPGLPLDLLAVACGLLRVRLRVLLPAGFAGLLAQFLAFAYLGEHVGRLIGL